MKHPFSYEVIYSSRKTLAIQITAEGSVKVRAPKNCPRSSIDR
ncbi:M48 family peptidase, partial [Romboutsia ilealis]|nr:M48 family peptidase [Romboutsia ilealis]